MNDRYLYRAKRKSDKKWIYGNLIQTDDGVYIIQNYVPQHLIGKYDVDPSTICQCTGLNDKNGKLIWENDILKYEWDGEERIDVIKYEAPIFTYSKSMRWSLYRDEIIGNIFDNPELINE